MNSGILGPGAAGQPNGTAVPIRVTEYTSGTGTFVPLARTRWLRVTLVGGGGAGGGSYPTGGPGIGGAAGAIVVKWLQKQLAAYGYAVGAGGAGIAASFGGKGGSTAFGPFTAPGGGGGGAAPGGANAASHPGQSCLFGAGGSGGPVSMDALGSGSGGGGATAAGNQAGGNGAPGLVIVEEYA